MAYDTEDAIVVTPPQDIETNDESETTPVEGNRGTSAAIVGTEPQEQPTYTFTRQDIKNIAKEEVQEEVDKGTFNEIVEANPTTTGSEPDLEALKVGGVKYKIPQGTAVVANPTLAGTESNLEGIEVGNTKYKVPQPTEVVANPTLAGTESNLEGLQVGDTKYKVGGGGDKIYQHSLNIYFKTASPVKEFYLFGTILSKDNTEITDLASLTTFYNKHYAGGATSGLVDFYGKGKGMPVSGCATTANPGIYPVALKIATSAYLLAATAEGYDILTAASIGVKDKVTEL